MGTIISYLKMSTPYKEDFYSTFCHHIFYAAEN